MMMMMEAEKEHLKYPDEQYSLTSAPLARRVFATDIYHTFWRKNFLHFNYFFHFLHFNYFNLAAVQCDQMLE